MKSISLYYCFAWLLIVGACTPQSTENQHPAPAYLNISGIYPHLTAYNQPEDSSLINKHRECGIGVVIPWAGKLWYLTYPPHMRTGSNDKLYSVDENLFLSIRPESIGGTHANRFIHRESNQLIMGPYVIDAMGNVRGVDVQQLEGRMTATTRHLTDPENKVMFYEMEGKVYEMDVHDLSVNQLFEKPVPGWHGKGAYVGQGRLVVANNGEHPGHSVAYSKLLVGGEAENWEEAGVLAEWDGAEWRIIERKKFTDVTGPGGIYGNASDSDPIWSMGWDKRSVILKLLDGGEWYTYRLPKGSHTFDPRHGWFTEWPRIREIGNGRMLMVMHGTMFDFPASFSRTNSGGIKPIATHLRYIPDFCEWNGQLVLAADDASTLQNPIVGQAQSNLWLGSADQLTTFGPRSGWGGVWVQDKVEAGVPSDPFSIAGYTNRVLHLAHSAGRLVEVELQIDPNGTNDWQPYHTVSVSAAGYAYYELPQTLDAQWIRMRTNLACTATAYFHMTSPRNEEEGEADIFAGLAPVSESAGTAIIRPAGHNRSLQVLIQDEYREVSLSADATELQFEKPIDSRADEVRELAALEKTPFEVDKASVILTDYDGRRFRLPKGPATYDQPGPTGYPRALREVQSERYLANIHGMFYEVPRAEGANNHVPEYRHMKPVSRHNKHILDYCSWRGLLVLSGVKMGAVPDGNTFMDKDGFGLWLGAVDDVWKFGKPTGTGGPWKEALIQAGDVSDPYLMTGFDQKEIELSHDADISVRMTLEVAINHFEWQEYETLEVPAGKTIHHQFPKGFQAHWIRVRADQDCVATAWLAYK